MDFPVLAASQNPSTDLHQCSREKSHVMPGVEGHVSYLLPSFGHCAGKSLTLAKVPPLTLGGYCTYAVLLGRPLSVMVVALVNVTVAASKMKTPLAACFAATAATQIRLVSPRHVRQHIGQGDQFEHHEAVSN